MRRAQRLLDAVLATGGPATAPEETTIAPARLSISPRPGLLRVSPTVLATIDATVGAQPAETGCVLGADPDGVIRHARFDHSAQMTRATYAPDIAMVNDERRHLERRGARFCGFAHSHPGELGVPSQGDRLYAQQLLARAKVGQLALPIVLPRGPERPAAEIVWYVARPGEGDLAEILPGRVEVDRRERGAEQFTRLAGAYDPVWLRRCRIVAIGCGGARQAIEDLARCGVGQFVLVDPDVVEEANLATQAVFRDEIGRPKALACADSLLRINPDAQVVAVQGRVEDLPREQVQALTREPWAGLRGPVRTLLGLWTDDFLANAYGHALALEAGLPAVWASLHRGAMSGEVGLVYPGLTRVCMRCAVPGRYAHYLAGGSNDAGSQGAPLWATARLNALKAAVVLAALHHLDPDEVPHPGTHERYQQTRLARRIAERPLAVMRLHPELASRGGLSMHQAAFAGAARADRLLFDETIWRETSPRAGCPDCGGEGDLARARGGLDAATGARRDPSAREPLGLRRARRLGRALRSTRTGGTFRTET